MGRIELVDDIGLEYPQKQRDFERFSQPEAKSEAISAIIANLQTVLQNLGKRLGATQSDFECELLSLAKADVRNAIDTLERLA